MMLIQVKVVTLTIISYCYIQPYNYMHQIIIIMCTCISCDLVMKMAFNVVA